jgi:outer membrane protein assembly factor BamB
MLARLLLGAIVSCAIAQSALAQSTTNVTTYHNDTYRTGWNQTETQLTPSSISAQTFGPLFTVPLDEQVDAQPLVYNNVVYTVTENNTVYAISPSTGQILQSLNLGAPVPRQALPGQCTNNSAVVGITSTPVIDPTTGIMYVVTYTYEGANPHAVYRLHMLQLPQSASAGRIYKIQNVVISASTKLSDGTKFLFAAQYQRQRAALLEANGNIYVSFASFCDYKASLSRGWVLGFNAATLAPLPSNLVTDAQTSAQTPPQPSALNNFFLSSIWMSGYGPATDSSGNLFFATGNSDGLRPYNLQNSVLKVSGDLTTIKDYFAPFNVPYLDSLDADLGAAGVMVIPDIVVGGQTFSYAIAQGKQSPLYTLDRTHLGGYNPSHSVDGPSIAEYRCWCGPSYYVGSDGVGRVVTSTGNNHLTSNLNQYTVTPGKTPNPLVYEASENLPGSVQDPGFFTSISSSGTTGQVIWAILRPSTVPPLPAQPNLSLYALDAKPLQQASGGFTVLYTGNAGTWPNLTGNANTVPTVANGKVFVGSYKALTIFGLTATASP